MKKHRATIQFYLVCVMFMVHQQRVASCNDVLGTVIKRQRKVYRMYTLPKGSLLYTGMEMCVLGVHLCRWVKVIHVGVLLVQ